ncbi:MAG: bifunctional adenosylcobinamide kinase/adenosylcobinamide-phosphate guanylyltransferase [Lachnospiraceae bacterium]|nr:bifunctional adenosylcobinamide kinase/adenosylcobinamide-phosphate guanylyltransferase [Lachnospiraceae bacterium]
MITLIIGIPDCGKSALAEQLTVENSIKEERVYIATMIPYGEEGRQRVLKHRKLRAGKGFRTIECPGKLEEIGDELNDDGSHVCLLECLTNLCGNIMHMDKYINKTTEELCDIITEDIVGFSEKCKALYIVSNEFDASDSSYDDETVKYIRLVKKVNEALKSRADRCYIYEGGAIMTKS